MTTFSDMIWVELRKALRSQMPLWTALASLFMPLGIAFLVFIARNAEISQKLGLIGAKANLMAYSTIDWAGYFRLFGQIVAAGGFFIFVLIISWIFGREFTDGTLKDILAVPVHRSSILLAKFVVMALWSAVLTLAIVIAGLLTGALIQLPGGSINVILQGSGVIAATAGMVITVAFPFAFFASAGRGYLIPVGIAFLTLVAANLVAVTGWGEYFPWAVAGLYVTGQSVLTPISYVIVLVTGLVGMGITYVWWQHADQSH